MINKFNFTNKIIKLLLNIMKISKDLFYYIILLVIVINYFLINKNFKDRL